MLQLRDLPTEETLSKFAQRYPQADISAIATFLNLLSVATKLSSALDQCLSRHGLLQGRWWVLILLMREEAYISTPSVLADKAGVSRATMTGLLDGLERDGLVERLIVSGTASVTDRRSISIRLTTAGETKLDQVMPDYYRRLRQCMAGLDEPGRKQLQQILALVNSGIGAFSDDLP